MKTAAERKVVKTTLELPQDLWKRVKIRALEEGEGDLRSVIIHALEAYLKKGGTK